MDIGFERCHTGLDLRQLSPVVWCLMCVWRLEETHKTWRKHIDSKRWDRLVTGRTCFPLSGEIHSFYSYCQESDCSLLYWISSTSHFLIPVRRAELIHNVRRVNPHVQGSMCCRIKSACEDDWQVQVERRWSTGLYSVITVQSFVRNTHFIVNGDGITIWPGGMTCNIQQW